MSVVRAIADFIPNVCKHSMYFGHQLGDVVLPRLLQKTGLSPVVSELAALPLTAAGAGGLMYVGGMNVLTPLYGMFVSSVFNPLGLAVFLPAFLLFAAVGCAGIGMGDVLLKKFGKTPVFDGIYDNMAFRSERKQKLNAKAASAKAEAELQQKQALNAEQPAPPAAVPGTPEGTKAFAGFEPSGADPGQPSFAGARSASGSFNTSSESGGVPKFAGFPPTADNTQAPPERPQRPARPDKP